MDTKAQFLKLVEQITEAEENSKRLRNELASVMNQLAQGESDFKIGDRVGDKQITNIEGSLNQWRPGNVIIIYYGRKVLKDGVSLHKTETRIWAWDLDKAREVRNRKEQG